MKLFKISITFLFLSLTTQVSSQIFKNAVDYLNFVGKEQKTITKSMWNYTKALAHSKSDRTISSKRNVLIKSVERAIIKIKRAGSFGGDTYKNQVLGHLNFNLDLLNQDYAKIVDMKAVAEQSYDAMEAYMLAQELADKKMLESQQEYETNFYAYANKHKIEIFDEETDLGKKMNISNKVFEHYNKMYLAYFKVSINEVYLMEALNKSDIGALQQSANALSESAKEGLKNLDTLKLYKGDPSVIDATKSIFNFFIDEADNKIATLTEFLILNENFKSIKNTIDKTPERKRTKTQIDNFNKQVNLVNKGVKEYNKINTYLNTSRQKLLEKLNMAKDNFLAKHIPKE